MNNTNVADIDNITTTASSMSNNTGMTAGHVKCQEVGQGGTGGGNGDGSGRGDASGDCDHETEHNATTASTITTTSTDVNLTNSNSGNNIVPIKAAVWVFGMIISFVML